MPYISLITMRERNCLSEDVRHQEDRNTFNKIIKNNLTSPRMIYNWLYFARSYSY